MGWLPLPIGPVRDADEVDNIQTARRIVLRRYGSTSSTPSWGEFDSYYRTHFICTKARETRQGGSMCKSRF